MKESLVSEAIEPSMDELADVPFQAGEPAMPGAFRWSSSSWIG